jgi:hypothetical protein
MVSLRENNRPVIVQYANPEDNGTAQGLIMPVMLHDMEGKEVDRQNLNAKLAEAYEKAQERKHEAEAMPE